MTRFDPKLSGTVYQHTLDGWDIAWESNGAYRHWCRQDKSIHSDALLIVMKNPGSLSGNGANLKIDSTLRILRVVGDATRVNWMVINLFDYATPKPKELHDNWSERDSDKLIYSFISKSDYRYVMFAHGNLDTDTDRRTDYTERVELVRESFASLCEIRIPTTKAGNPVHPMNWQRGKFIDEVIDSINRHTTGA